MFNPLEQFEITRLIQIVLGKLDLSITVSTISMVTIVLVFIGLFNVVNPIRIIPSRWQSILELLYEFVLTIIREQIGNKGLPYFSFLLTLFVYILLNNYIGLIPYAFTSTAHLSVTFGLSFTVFFGVTILGFSLHGLHFITLLIPSGVSPVLVPLIFTIELISYCMRAISLGVRLAANMIAGHALLHILSGFTWQFYTSKKIIISILSILPFTVLVALCGLEFVIAFLQAYVFTVLTCSYLKDSYYLH